MSLSRKAAIAVFLAQTLVGSAWATEGFAFFETEVRPILVARCYECHSEQEGKDKGGLWLDRKAGWEQGGDAGPTLVPGDVEASLLIHSIEYGDEDLQMPPKSKLPDSEIEILKKWVAMGAPDPRDEALAGAMRKEAIDYDSARESWAFRPLDNVEPPAVSDESWIRSDVDRFLLAELDRAGLEPTSNAESSALLRRVYYDLIGLPPTREELAAFEKDNSPEAFAKIVDDLLSRPGFGEKWGRHWLDVARYADSNGGDRNFTFYQAWRYRNYVIDSFNSDRSYYEFVREQLAGDLLTSDDTEDRRRQIIASTFLTLGPKMLTERDKEKLWLDTADEQLDTVGRAFLGLTFGCARCHDHKFDPVSQKDYYAMAGIFRSTEVVTGTRNGCVNVASWVERPLPSEGGNKQLAEKVERLELAMRLTVEKSFMKKAGGKMSLDNLPLAGVIVDDADAELVGEWVESTYSSNRFGERYIHDDQKHKGKNKAIFRASVPESGVYEVRLAYNASENRASNLPVTIEARDAIYERTLDETKRPSIGGLFEPIGRFKFEKGARCNVIIGTEGTEGRYAIVDAVQFIAVPDIEREEKAIAAMGGDEVDPIFQMNEGELKKELNRLISELKDGDLAMAPRDADDSDDIHLRVRGEVGQLGELVKRDFPRALYDGPTPEIGEGESGRLQFADWLVSGNSGLLDRVFVNRVWHHLFHRGIVKTVDNFGRLGTGASHPELLEYLASSFRENGGSVKTLVREIVTSRAYQLSCDAPAELADADPANKLFGRQNRRRLTAEELRDSVLFLAGELDRTPGEATATPKGVDLDKNLDFKKERQRTVYLPIARNNPVPELALFDAANPDLVSGARAGTTVPTQALYLLNSETIHAQAAKIGKMALDASKLPGEEVDWLYQTLLGRSPNPVESQRALGLIADLSGASEDAADIEVACGHLAHLLLASTEFLYLD